MIVLLSCEAGASWPDGEKVLNYLKEVDHLGVTGEIRFDSDGFRTDVQLDLIEKVRGRFRKTATWTPEAGVNYTMTSEEIGTQMIEKLANRTLRVVTTPVSYLQSGEGVYWNGKVDRFKKQLRRGVNDLVATFQGSLSQMITI